MGGFVTRGDQERTRRGAAGPLPTLPWLGPPSATARGDAQWLRCSSSRFSTDHPACTGDGVITGPERPMQYCLPRSFARCRARPLDATQPLGVVVLCCVAVCCCHFTRHLRILAQPESRAQACYPSYLVPQRGIGPRNLATVPRRAHPWAACLGKCRKPPAEAASVSTVADIKPHPVRDVTDGPGRPLPGGMLRAVGMDDEDFAKPDQGRRGTKSPCNLSLDRL